jgi:hypothetical protein
MNYQVSIIAWVEIETAFKAITQNISEWWAKDFKGKADQLNACFTVRFGKTFGEMKIVELIPNKKITWQVIDNFLDLFHNKKEWLGTSLEWEFASVGNSTAIKMTHAGLTPDKECFKDCQNGWDFFIKQSLQKFLSEGKGIPGYGIRGRITLDGRTVEGTIYGKKDNLPEFPGSFTLVDVKELKGEEVVSAHSIRSSRKIEFNPGDLEGEYFMIVNKS